MRVAKKKRSGGLFTFFLFVMFTLGLVSAGGCIYEGYLFWGDPTVVLNGWASRATLAYAWFGGAAIILGGMGLAFVFAVLGTVALRAASSKGDKKARRSSRPLSRRKTSV